MIIIIAKHDLIRSLNFRILFADDTMKRTFWILLFGLVIRGLVFSQTSTENGFTQFFYGNGKVSSEGTMRDGKPDGLWTSYYPNGQIKSIGKRTNFALDSIWKFYTEQGFLSEEISFLNGKKSGYLTKYQGIIKNDSLLRTLRSKELYLNDNREGQAFYYSNTGKLERIVRFKEGKKHGLTRVFNEDSLISVLYKYHNDFLIDREFINQYDALNRKQGLWKSLYDNDNIRVEETYKDGLLHGYYREYSPRGQLLVSRFYEQGVEIEKADPEEINIEIQNEFDDKGRIISSGGFVNNTPVGIHRKYTDNRSVIQTTEYSSSGQLISNGITDEKGQKDDYWKFFYSTGEIRSEGNFNNNVRTGVWKYYYQNGQLEQSGSFKNGEEDGLWTWFYENGSVRREENYYRGKEDGPSVEYDRDGTILSKGEFIEGLEEGEWYYHVGDFTEKGFFKGGEKDGLWEQFYGSGAKKFSGQFIQGYPNGKHRYFYEDGKIKEEQFFEMGRRERTWRVFDELGNVSMSISYEDDVISKIDGIKVNIEDSK